MQSLFRINYEGNARYQMVPGLQRARFGLTQNMEICRKFYHNAFAHANNENIIVRLLFLLGISETQPTTNVYRNISRRTNNINNTMGLTSAVSRGSVFNNHFFKNSRELVIGYAGVTASKNNWSDWKNMSPLRVLSHPFTDLWGNVPDGKPNAGGALSVFSIDIPMLAGMYSCFLKEQVENRENGGDSKGITQFIYAYVLANTHKDMIDIAMFNRMNCMLTGEPLNDHRRLHSRATVDYTAVVDQGIQVQLDQLMRLHRRVPVALEQTQLIFSKSLAELSELPEVAPTIQCFWALVVSRLKMLSFALRTMSEGGRGDQASLNRIQWSINLHRTPNVIRNNLPIAAYVQVLPDLNYVMGL